MKNKLNLSTLQKLTRSLACFGAVFTMVMSPVALGAEAQQQFTAKRMQAGLDELGLNKQMTLSQFYQKNKDLFPPRVQKEMEQLIAENKNQMMPHFEVATSKGSDGKEVPTL